MGGVGSSSETCGGVGTVEGGCGIGTVEGCGVLVDGGYCDLWIHVVAVMEVVEGLVVTPNVGAVVVVVMQI